MLGPGVVSTQVGEHVISTLIVFNGRADHYMELGWTFKGPFTSDAFTYTTNTYARIKKKSALQMDIHKKNLIKIKLFQKRRMNAEIVVYSCSVPLYKPGVESPLTVLLSEQCCASSGE